MDESAPTVALDLVMLTAIIDAQEGRYVTIVDITEAFLSASMTEAEIVHTFYKDGWRN